MPPRHPPIPSTFLRPSSSSSSSSSPSSPLASHAAAAPVRPLSIAELADCANEASDALPFSPSIPIRRYLNGANTLRRQAAVYKREGDRESEFVCLVKCARLLIELLPNSHPQYKSLDPDTRRTLKRDGQQLLDAISDAKSFLANKYEAWNALPSDVKASYRTPDSDSSSTGAGGSVRARSDSRGSRDARSASLGRASGVKAASQGSSPRASNPPSPFPSMPAAPVIGKTGEQAGIPFRKPDRGDDGFDVRRILGFGKSSADGKKARRELPTEIPYQPPSSSTSFTSSPLEPFTHSHGRAKSKPHAAASRLKGEIKSISYPVLQPKLSSRMSIHQTQQGFAPSSNATARYYQTLKAGESGLSGAAAGGYSAGYDYPSVPHAPSSSSMTTSAMPAPMHHRPPPIPGAPSLPPPPLPPQPQAQMPVPHHSVHPPPPPPQPQPKPRSLRGPLPAVPAYPREMPLPFGVSRDAHGPATSDVLSQAVQQMTLGIGGRSNTLGREAATLLASAQAGQQVDEPIRAHTEGGQPLRSLHVPEELIGAFVGIADDNTRANLETCALLQGKLERNAFRVSHLVFPQQTATSDSCTTQNEEEIMAFQEGRDLITLGWIHTHPTQSCFLSSLDLHTHAGYQMMLPEAIAIVCSPQHEPSFGLFRLTDPTGLKFVVSCREPGLFHPHVSKDGRDLALYTDAIYGHVRLASDIGLEIVDLRK